ncbi:ligase-associated DNA damage response endonuclease PdeM [Roseiterribacter gracilis]|uniref:Metallophosphatase n=1 Tax=Roseiterribacter gracilis TaxID=2812848 RepID=A0A8S8X8X7_9PROT|nr:metallophosphatase [Rhodospirillales bacterium TMPK1]
MNQYEFALGEARLVPDLSGALWWPDEATMIVADLHLEKGSSYAQRSAQFLPPYDTTATLDKLERAIRCLHPSRIIALGDSIHDPRAVERIDDGQAARVAAITETVEWIWVAGNHDPSPPVGWGGRVEQEITIGPLTFRHEAQIGALREISGHYHPKARVPARGSYVHGRCFAHDRKRAVLPAFGAYAGGLNVLDPAIATLFEPDFAVTVIGKQRLFRFAAAQLA